ncbi:choline/ethanolaminephosphotransferase 2-like [Malus domestica]|uniref:choline/ethanolaminephosphotransferase 2-like n=1 Tax=Malus domestica TaxID=3750 RepID=UPI0039757259
MIAFAVLPTLTFNVSNLHKVVQARKASTLLALAMSLLYLPLNDGVPWVDESLVLLGYCAFTGTVVHEITTFCFSFRFRRACKVENGAAQGRFLVDTKCKQGISTFACFRYKT